MNATAPLADRYTLVDLGGNLARVRDETTGDYLTGGEYATQVMSARDAHDLHQEYIWS